MTVDQIKIIGLDTKLSPKDLTELLISSCLEVSSTTVGTPFITTAHTLAQCKYSPWSDWSSCSKTCGLGTQTRERRTLSPDQCEPKPTLEFKDCATNPCSFDCKWAPWTSWSPCSQSCSGGMHQRHRAIKEPAKNGGVECTGPQNQTESCNSQSCGPGSFHVLVHYNHA